MKLTKALPKVIELAKTIRTYWDTELPKRHPNYPLIGILEDSGPPPPEEEQLRELLAKLQAEDIYKLILIMYLGRGDFDTNNIPYWYDHMKKTFEKPKYAINQMMGKSPLAEYLEEGMAKLAQSGISIDDLLKTHVS